MSQMQVGGRGSPIKPKCPNVKMSPNGLGGGEGSENFGTMSQSLLFFFEGIPYRIIYFRHFMTLYHMTLYRMT